MVVTYDDVNAAWPADLPAITVDKANKYAKRLWRAFAREEGARKNGLLYHLSRNYRSWGSTARTRNSRRCGWRRMVHDVSHTMLESASPAMKAHGCIHAELELRLIRHVIDSGWLDKRQAKPKPDVKAVRYARVLASIERWESKKRRADKALRKLRSQRRYYEKTLGEKADVRNQAD